MKISYYNPRNVFLYMSIIFVLFLLSLVLFNSYFVLGIGFILGLLDLIIMIVYIFTGISYYINRKSFVYFGEDHVELAYKDKKKKILYENIGYIQKSKYRLSVITRDGKCFYIPSYFKDNYKRMYEILHEQTSTRLMK